MIRIGITGQSGFIGTHLYNTLGLLPKEVERVAFDDSFFLDNTLLEKFVQNCDAIIHLAALNRHNDPNTLYETNLKLVKQLITACETSNSKPHILFSSSIQEDRDNLYGKSKKEGRLLFKQWAERNNASFTGLIIPNVYGPFGHPYYNSVVATFCHQLTHNEQPKIEIDGTLKLIHVSELVAHILDNIKVEYAKSVDNKAIEDRLLPHSTEVKVSEILEILTQYKAAYFEKGEMPALDSVFHRHLFTMFLCAIDHTAFFPFKFKLNTDERGSFVETMKLKSGGQVSFSTTVSGVTRGNHFHTRKVERFAVIKGKARIELRKIGTNKIISFELDGKEPAFVDMPIWYSHNITNIGEEELYTIFWINEHYDPNDADTYFEKV